MNRVGRRERWEVEQESSLLSLRAFHFHCWRTKMIHGVSIHLEDEQTGIQMMEVWDEVTFKWSMSHLTKTEYLPSPYSIFDPSKELLHKSKELSKWVAREHCTGIWTRTISYHLCAHFAFLFLTSERFSLPPISWKPLLIQKRPFNERVDAKHLHWTLESLNVMHELYCSETLSWSTSCTFAWIIFHIFHFLLSSSFVTTWRWPCTSRLVDAILFQNSCLSDRYI